jgi:signal transduction histidine kinase
MIDSMSAPDFSSGGHVCPVVEGLGEQSRVLCDFIESALEQQERFIVAASAREMEDLTAMLERRGVDVEHERRRRVIDLVTEGDLVQPEDFSPSVFLQALDRAERAARTDGYRGLRFAGVNGFLDVAAELVRETESRLNETLENSELSLICLYDRARFDAAVLHEAVHLHPSVLIRERRLDNPYFGLPDMPSGGGTESVSAFKRKRAFWFLERLASSVDTEREREALFERALQAQGMESLRRLAGGIAHDFNNLLTTISGFTDLLSKEMEPGAPARELANEVLAAAERSATLTEKLLSFSRAQVVDPRPVDIVSAVEGMRPVIERMVGDSIRLVVRIGDAPVTVRADTGQIEQVLLNLVTNAETAMRDGGTLTLAAGRREMDRAFTVNQTELPAGRYGVLSVQDTGSGIPSRVLPHIFEPFFTTAPRGGGTGLGLAVVYGIVRQSGGAVEVETEVDEGTTFRIWLPMEESIPTAAERPGETGTATRAEKRSGERSGSSPTESAPTVLVAEHQEEVRGVLGVVLPRLGYRVLQAADGAEVVHVLQDHGTDIDLVLFDSELGGVEGLELSEWLTREKPQLPVVQMVAAASANAPGANILTKPFRTAQLRQALREALEDVSPSGSN